LANSGKAGSRAGLFVCGNRWTARFITHSSNELAPTSVHKTKSMEPQITRNIADLLTLSGGQCIHVRRIHPMTNRFLISVAAAALIAGTGFANAQGMSREGGGAAGGAATQQTAPSGGGAMQRDSGGAGGMKGAESSGMKGSDSGMKAESNEKMPASKSAQDTKSGGDHSKSMSSENDAKGSKDMKAEGRDSKSGTNAAEGSKANGNVNAQTKTGADSKSTTTTGNAATSATAAPPAEKRTQITSAIKSERIEETTNVNFNISVGATIPGSVRFHPLPARIVEIYPEWRGYDVIFVRGQYIIVRPQTHEIVYIIEG
jgi:Protein of unknown function (DUF1236)